MACLSIVTFLTDSLANGSERVLVPVTTGVLLAGIKTPVRIRDVPVIALFSRINHIIPTVRRIERTDTRLAGARISRFDSA
jgi:hypothetical protein